MIAGRKPRGDRSQNPAYRPARVAFLSPAVAGGPDVVVILSSRSCDNSRVAEIVDGNNLIGRLGGGTREGLVSELCEVARLRRKKLTVVFDGPPEGGRPKVQAFGDVTVVYAAPRSADEEIIRRIREARDPRGVTVVTDDRALASAVSGAGARTAGIGVFQRDASARLGAPVPADAGKPPVGGGVKDWERWFTDPKNRIG